MLLQGAHHALPHRLHPAQAGFLQQLPNARWPLSWRLLAAGLTCAFSNLPVPLASTAPHSSFLLCSPFFGSLSSPNFAVPLGPLLPALSVPLTVSPPPQRQELRSMEAGSPHPSDPRIQAPAGQLPLKDHGGLHTLKLNSSSPLASPTHSLPTCTLSS